MSETNGHPPEPDVRRLLRNFFVELVIYGTLVTLYFFLVLQFLESYLTDLFYSNLTGYAVIGLLLIILQGALLDGVTSFLLNQIKLDRFD